MSTTEQELLEKILAELKKISTQLVVANRHPAYIIHHENTKWEEPDPRLWGDPPGRLGG